MNSNENDKDENISKVKTELIKNKDLKQLSAPPSSQGNIGSAGPSNENINHERPKFLKGLDGEATNLEIPSEEYMKMSSMMAVYWPEKSQFMKVVLFVQIGKMQYYVFRNEAILIHGLFGKNMDKFYASFMTFRSNLVNRGGLYKKYSNVILDLETKHIFEKETKDYFVVIDKLGRGTSTFDRVSIAAGALQELVKIGFLTIFSTLFNYC